MRIETRLQKLESRRFGKRIVNVFAENTPDGRCFIKEQMHYNFGADGYAHSTSFRTFTIDSIKLYKAPNGATMGAFMSGLDELED